MTSSLLSLCQVHKSFGAVKVTDGVAFDLAAGEALGVIGPNGAGKSTLFSVISGTLAPASGTIWLDGENITDRAAAWRSRHGIARSFQVPQPFIGLTVYENVLAASFFGAGLKGREAETHAMRVLDRTALSHRAATMAGDLTLLDRKRLELARALATRPRLLLLDEIAGGLTEGECKDLIAIIRQIRNEGVTIVWIEHIVHALLAVVDRLIVLDTGRLIADGDPREVISSPEVVALYTGIPHD